MLKILMFQTNSEVEENLKPEIAHMNPEAPDQNISKPSFLHNIRTGKVHITLLSNPHTSIVLEALNSRTRIGFALEITKMDCVYLLCQARRYILESGSISIFVSRPTPSRGCFDVHVLKKTVCMFQGILFEWSATGIVRFDICRKLSNDGWYAMGLMGWDISRIGKGWDGRGWKGMRWDGLVGTTQTRRAARLLFLDG